jgi:hypothetical protein
MNGVGKVYCWKEENYGEMRAEVEHRIPDLMKTFDIFKIGELRMLY